MSRSPKQTGIPPVSPPVSVPAAYVPQANKRTGSKMCCGCLGGLFVILVLIVGWVLWLVAATGITSVPLLSRAAYEEPKPLRVVKAGEALKIPFDSEALHAFEGIEFKEGEEPSAEQLEQFEQFFDEEALKDLFVQLDDLGGSLSANRFNFVVTEEMLTGSLRQAGTNSTPDQQKDTWVDLTQAQVAISEKDGLEVFLPLARNAQHSAIRVYFTPRVTDKQELDMDLREIWVGNMRIPSWFTGPFNEGLFRKAVAGMVPELAKYARIEELTIEEGSIALRGTLTEAFRGL